jgi:hypothetical protein
LAAKEMFMNRVFGGIGLAILLLVPAVSLLNETNAASGYGSVGLAANNCRTDWGRAPNILNVDYYNYGTPAGSVFEAAARLNNVTYNNTCCGKVQSSDASALIGGGRGVFLSWAGVMSLLASAFLML